MDTNKDYEHPVIGPLTDYEVEHVLWIRRLQEKSDNQIQYKNVIKKEKLDEIILDLMKENVREFDPGREDNHMWSILEKIVKRLQKFRDEEL